ncbi:alpha/beta hydrolase [Rhodococcus sp. NPDC127528]|uniref:alpha/beta hydrolase n=1 Tax=unclassified Rhodococcus (in: high G+C Gram-positive bacteria) TaxID=192944 RepID=UPI0036381195
MLVSLAMLLPLGVSVAGPVGTASAAFDRNFGSDFWVDSDMGPIKSRVFRAANGNTDRVVYALDGMRARNDLNGWEIETNVARALTAANINVVMPVGGESSFYADWNAPSTWGPGELGSSSGSSGGSSGIGSSDAAADADGKANTYRWETFLTRQLPAALNNRLGFSSTRNGVFGLSMGGSAALTLAAYFPQQFSFAGSYSGFLNNSAPGMREALRVAMISAGGFNIDAMAPPWGPQWLRMDPFVFAPRLKDNNTRLWISSGSAVPGQGDVTDALGIVQAVPLEALALINTRAFEVRMATLGARNVHYDYPATGVHNWKNWEDQVNRMIPDLSASIGRR